MLRVVLQEPLHRSRIRSVGLRHPHLDAAGFHRPQSFFGLSVRSASPRQDEVACPAFRKPLRRHESEAMQAAGDQVGSLWIEVGARCPRAEHFSRATPPPCRCDVPSP